MSQQIFTTAFTAGTFGYATAMGVVLAAVTMVFVGLVFLVFRLVGGPSDRQGSRS
jgi:N-acetylglucosamine transport system permease protein